MQNTLVRMSLGTRLGLAGAALLILASFAYLKRVQIEVTVWHWKNGDSVRVGNYEVPVPRDWLVRVDPAGITSLMATHSSRDPNASVIMIFSSPPAGSFEFWISYRRQSLKQDGVVPIEERSLRFEDETVVCLGGHELKNAWGAENAVSLECKSSSRDLHLMFVGQQRDLEVMYAIISNIHRARRQNNGTK